LNAPLVIHGKINGSAAPIDHNNIDPTVRRCGDATDSTLRVLELEARLLTATGDRRESLRVAALVESAAGGGARSDYGSTLIKLIAAMPTSPAYATDTVTAEMKILSIFALLPLSVCCTIVAHLDV
jgi:hypothetical protein